MERGPDTHHQAARRGSRRCDQLPQLRLLQVPPHRRLHHHLMGTFIDECDDYYQALAELYVLGERLLDDSIRAAVVKEIMRLTDLVDERSFRSFPARETVNIIYRGTTAGSPARRLMVDIQVSYGSTKTIDSACEASFVHDVVQRLYTKMEGNSSISQMRGSLNESDYLS